MILKRLFILIIIVYNIEFVFSQLETQNWYFGLNAGISFASNPPLALTDGQLSTNEGCASFSDSKGNLLFYTDGIKVYNRLHQQMPNGFGLSGNPSSAQSAIILPKLGSEVLYYVFTVDAEGGPLGFRYSLIDMSMNNGLGDVVNSSKNTLLFAPSVEKTVILKHSNGIDYWVIAHGLNNNYYYAYLIDCKGVNPPVISKTGQIEGNPGWGYMSVSSDGKKIATAMCFKGFELLDFDNNTGIISNPILLYQPNSGSYGVAFSPNNKLLYGCNAESGEIFQWDLQSSNPTTIISSRKIIGKAKGSYLGYIGGAIQLGLDGKLYIPQCGESYLSVIENPNQLGISCNLKHNAINLNGRKATFGLPPFVQSYFNQKSRIIKEISCKSVNFSIDNKNIINDSVRWYFEELNSNELNTSNSILATHKFEKPGVYNISFIRYKNCFSDTIKDTINIKSCIIDSDKDGISDEEDIDDDNDGVLDFDEGVCNNVYQGYVPNEFQVIKYDLGAAYYKTPTNLLPKNKLSLSAIYKCVVPGQINWPLTYADNHVRSYIPSNQISYKNGYSSESNVNITIFRVIVPKGYNNVQQSITRFQADGGSNIWKNSQLIADMCCGDEGGPSGPLTTDYFVNTNDTIEFRSVNGLPVHQSTNFEFKKILGKCVVPDDIDTDGDGVVNRLDLDSDGDGCGDAFESGATKNKSVTFFIGNVGKNGLVDSLESIVDSGVYNYDNTYKLNALDKNVVMCMCDLPTNLKLEHLTYCNSEDEKLILKTGEFNSYSNGTYNSFPTNGLFFNSLTGSITPKMSSPGEYVLNYNVPQKGNCPAFSVKTNNFKINPLPTINAGIDTNVCIGTPAILKAKGGISYQWDNGVEDKKSFIPQETKVYKVIGTDINGCKNSDELEVKVNPNPLFDLSVTDPCEKQTLAFAVNLGPQTASVGVKSSVWTGVSNYTSSELNPIIPNVTLTQKGNYGLTLTDNNNCQTQKSITADVSPEDQIEFADLGSKCLNDIVFNLPEPNIKGGSWSTNDNTSIQDEKQGLFDPSKSKPNSEKQVEVTYTTSTIVPARKCPSQKTKTIIINSLPNINAGIDTNVCFGTPAILKAKGGISYQWDNGVEDKKSFIPQQTKVYKVIGTDINGCKNSDEVEVNLNPNPEFDLSVTDPCEKQTLAFTVNLGTQTTSVGVKSSVWTGVSNFTSSELNPIIPTVTLTQKGSYSLLLTDNNNCQTQKSITANVSPEDQIEFADLGSKCVNDLIFSLPIVNIKGGTWSSNDNTSIQDEKKGLFDPSKSKPNSDKQVEVTYTTSTIVPVRKCPSQKTKTIIINPIPDSVFYSLEQVICEEDAISFKVANPNMYAKYMWEFGDGTKKEGLNPVYTYMRDGLFKVKLTSILGDCKVQQVKNEYIKVIPKPKDIDFIPSVTEIDFYNPDVEFKTYTKGKYYEWSFGDETGSTEQNPKHKYAMVPGSYLVTLRVSNMENHCDQSVSKVLLMPEPLVYFIPNTFSPNGDEINNIFQPIFTYGYDPERYSFYVYNRWGTLVFESHNVAIGWDGTFGNDPAPNDTYVWKLEFKEKSLDRMHSKEGVVNLLR